MDEQNILSQTLNTMMNRHMKAVQNYEVEIANYVAEIAKLQSDIENLQNQNQDVSKRLTEALKDKPKTSETK